MNTPNNISVSFTPTLLQMDEIGKWLLIEHETTGDGFYRNWNVIKTAYSNGEMATLLIDGSPIGFVIWNRIGKFTKIDIAEIKPSFRRQGYGKLLIDHLLAFLRKRRIAVVELNCQPPETAKIWKKMGFVEFPDLNPFIRFRSEEDKHLYKILVYAELPSIVIDDDESIELWSSEPYQANSIDASWTWKLSFKNDNGRLSKPIIWPCFPDWRIRWKKGDNVIKDCKIKYFQKQEIRFGKFLVIQELRL